MPEGGSGNDDEFRSTVFDESFVRAARIQELSARERLGSDFSRGARSRIRLGPFGSVPRQVFALLLLVVMAFAVAVYFGVSSPRRQILQPVGSQLTVSLVALTPSSPVRPVPDQARPYAALSGYADGVAGLGVPSGAATAHFSRSEVGRALATVRQYLTGSALNPAVLVENETGTVRGLITRGELAQFDRSIAGPVDDQHHVATGWLVRFDPGQVALATDTVKVTGTVTYAEADSSTLEVTADHTLVYALRPAGTATGPVTLFEVRRALHFQLDRTDLSAGQLRLVDAVVQAGPSSCGARQADYLQPILAGTGSAPSAPPAINPADHSRPAWQFCGTLGGSLG